MPTVLCQRQANPTSTPQNALTAESVLPLAVLLTGFSMT